MEPSCLRNGALQLLSVLSVIFLPVLLRRCVEILFVELNLVFGEVLLFDDDLKGALLTLPSSPAQDLDVVRLVLGDEGLDDVHSSLFVDFVVVHLEVRPPAERNADERNPVLRPRIVNQRIPHFWRHLFGYLVDVLR